MMQWVQQFRDVSPILAENLPQMSSKDANGSAEGKLRRRDSLRRTKYVVASVLLLLAVAAQVFFTAFFVLDAFGPMLGIHSAPLEPSSHQWVSVGAAVGLVMGIVFGTGALLYSDSKRREAEGKLDSLSRAFHELLDERFSDWGLTPAERDVANFVMKGFSTQEIAEFRKTSEGTVKAQTAAIYRKAGVTGRVQLTSLFLDDLMNGPAQ